MSAKFVIICLSHSSAFADSLYSSHCWPRATEDMHCAGYFHSFCLLWSFMKFYLNFPWLNISMRVSFQTLLTKECVCQKFWRFCISPRLLHQLWKGNCKKQTIAWTWSKNSGSFSHLVFVSFLSEQPYKCWWFRCVCDSNCVGDIVILGVPWEPYVPEICPLFHITVFLTKYSHSCHILLAPSGALVFIMGYYISNSTA